MNPREDNVTPFPGRSGAHGLDANGGRLPRRILMTTETSGGVWTFAIELARGLAPAGVEVHLATLGAPPTPAQRADTRIPGVFLYESDFRSEWTESAWPSVESAGRWLLDLEQRVQPELVHLNGCAHAVLPWQAPVVVTGHSCTVSWWHAVHGEAPPATWRRHALEVRRGLRAAKLVAAPTLAMLVSLAAHHGPLPRVAVIPHGRDPDRFHPGSKRRRILSVGRLWDPAKNLAALDRIAARLPWTVRVAGEMHRSENGVSRMPHAVPLGRLDEPALAAEMASAGIFALPAVYEPFGFSALEAGLSGCALVLGDIPSLREVWDDAACWVPPRDDAALLDTLLWLIDRPRVRQEYASRALDRARLYIPRRMAHGYARAYRSVMAELEAPVTATQRLA
jgi:glycosyltransferase involved in cell wall biosynthesis